MRTILASGRSGRRAGRGAADYMAEDEDLTTDRVMDTDWDEYLVFLHERFAGNP